MRRWIRQWRARRAWREWEALVTEAQRWDDALTFVAPGRRLLRIAQIRDTYRSGQKIYFNRAIAVSGVCGPTEAGWIYASAGRYHEGTWLGVHVPRAYGRQSNGDGYGEHHDENVLYIHNVSLWVPDSTRIAWHHTRTRSAPPDPARSD
ncbi:hypothetical protein BH23ACT10_BH23ACT10_29180 [soil metagenome]